MGLLNAHYTGQLFTQAWVNAIKGTPEKGMTATIKLYDPTITDAVYDPATNTYVNTTEPLYEGKARVQPLRSSRQINQAGNPSYGQVVQFQIPIDEGKLLDIRPRHRVEVTACDLNPALMNFLYAVHEVMDSSNPVERTFVCTVNLETVIG